MEICFALTGSRWSLCVCLVLGSPMGCSIPLTFPLCFMFRLLDSEEGPVGA